MNSSNHSLSLTQRLQEKLDAAVQSPQGFSKGADKPYPNVISESGDDTASDLSGSISSARDLDDKGDNENVIKCSYRNFSQVLPDKADGPSSLIAQSSTAKEPTFPVKLHMILSNPEFQDIISWLPHGRSWRILQQKAFEERVIPLYFRHGRYSSFARQVNGWGFRRVTHGSDYNSYYHEVRHSISKREHSLCLHVLLTVFLRCADVPSWYASLVREDEAPHKQGHGSSEKSRR